MLRILSIVEGTYVTGPIRPLIMLIKELRARADQPAKIQMVATVRTSPDLPMQNQLLTEVAISGIEMHAIRESRRFDLGVLRQLATLVRAQRPNIVESHDTKCHFLLLLCLKLRLLKRNFKWLCYHHGYTRTSRIVRIYQQLDRLSLRAADGVITVCRPFADQVRERGVPEKRIQVISNPAPVFQHKPTATLTATRDILRVRSGEKLIVTVGRLSKEKGHADLLRAMVFLRSAAPEAVLVLVGDGPERGALEAQAAADGVRALFVGQQTDVAAYLQIADVFAMPSHSEGSPLALLEAMGAGLPIVATTVGGIPETVKNGKTALLVDAHAPASLASELLRLLHDSTLAARLGSAALHEASRRSVHCYADNMLRIYDSYLQACI